MTQITTIKQLAVSHPYYCSSTNYYDNNTRGVHDTWASFMQEYEDCDIDYNLIFRWDILERNEENEHDCEGVALGEYYMELFFIGQRKGLFWSVTVNRVTDADVPSIVSFLKRYTEYFKTLWQPLQF